jgi:hypothetical protein
MFAEVHDEVLFSLNVYRGTPSEVNFDQFTNAFLPSQIEDSYADTDGHGEIPGKKNADGNWDTRGHKDRVIRIDRTALETIHALSEEESVPVEEARFIQPFSTSTLEVFKQLSTFPKVGQALVDKDGEPTWQMARHWDETNAQKDGTILRRTEFRPLEEMVIQGPLFHISNPLYKSPRRVSKNNSDYDVIDLESSAENYLPRTNYGPNVPMAEYLKRRTKCRWDNLHSHGDLFRLAIRRMIALNGERSLISAIIPPKVLHVHGIESIATKNIDQLLTRACIDSSLIMDFFIKASGISNLFSSDVARFPHFSVSRLAKVRLLKLNCLTSSYRCLWEDYINDNEGVFWSKSFQLENFDTLDQQQKSWDRNSALRAELLRRQALVEIDVLVAKALNISLEQLIELYRIYFPVLQENEDGTWYDQNGRIVWTCSKGLPGVGYLNEKGKSPGRKEWESILESNPSELVCTAVDDTMPDGPKTVERRFVGPFFKCDRIEDYKRAWAHFEKLEREGKL